MPLLGLIARTRRTRRTGRTGRDLRREPPMARQERREVRADGHRTDARPTTAVRNAERLVQVQMRHIGAELPRRRKSDHRIHVGAVDIDLPAIGMDDFAKVANAFFEHTVRRWVGDHDGRQPRPMLFRFRAQVVEIDVAVGIAGDDDHLHPHHLRRCRIGSMRRRRDEAHVAAAAIGSARFMPRLDDQEAGVFALRSRIRLQRHRCVPRRLHQHLLELANHLDVALRLLARRKRMQRTELRPRHWDHLARRVELHRARPQRNHRAVEREILVGEPAQIAKHLVFGVMAIEDRMGEEGRGTPQRDGNRVSDGCIDRIDGESRIRVAEAMPDLRDIFASRRLVERDAYELIADLAKVDLKQNPMIEDGLCSRPGLDQQRVEKARHQHLKTDPAQAFGDDARHTVNASRDPAKTFRPVIDRVHRGDHREQHLRGADVRRRLLATNVLLARLQREAVRMAAVGIDRRADEPARHRPLELVAGRKECRVRSAVAHRHAEALRVADDDVGTPFAGRRQQRQCEQVGRHAEKGVFCVNGIGDGAHVVDRPGRRRILRQHAEKLARLDQLRRRADDDLDAERLRARLHDVDGLRMTIAGYDKDIRRIFRDATRQRHRFGGRGCFIEHRRIGDRHRRQIADHRLEIDQGFETALRDLRLVRRVRGVPGGILENVAENDARRMRAVVALSDERFVHRVLRRQRSQLRQRLGLAPRWWQIHWRGPPDRRRHQCVDQRSTRRIAERLEHLLLLGFRWPDVAPGERVVLFQRRQRNAVHVRDGFGGGRRVRHQAPTAFV